MERGFISHDHCLSVTDEQTDDSADTWQSRHSQHTTNAHASGSHDNLNMNDYDLIKYSTTAHHHSLSPDAQPFVSHTNPVQEPSSNGKASLYFSQPKTSEKKSYYILDKDNVSEFVQDLMGRRSSGVDTDSVTSDTDTKSPFCVPYKDDKSAISTAHNTLSVDAKPFTLINNEIATSLSKETEETGMSENAQNALSPDAKPFVLATNKTAQSFSYNEIDYNSNTQTQVSSEIALTPFAKPFVSATNQTALSLPSTKSDPASANEIDLSPAQRTPSVLSQDAKPWGFASLSAKAEPFDMPSVSHITDPWREAKTCEDWDETGGYLYVLGSMHSLFRSMIICR